MLQNKWMLLAVLRLMCFIAPVTKGKGNVFDLGIGAEWFESCASYVPELDKENRGPSPKRKRLDLKKVPMTSCTI